MQPPYPPPQPQPPPPNNNGLVILLAIGCLGLLALMAGAAIGAKYYFESKDRAAAAAEAAAVSAQKSPAVSPPAAPYTPPAPFALPTPPVLITPPVVSDAPKAEPVTLTEGVQKFLRENPDFELVSLDEARKVFIVKEKATGKTMTVNATRLDNDEYTITTSDGITLAIGGAASVPAWVPQYPGSSPKQGFHADEPDKLSASFSFTTNDTPDMVRAFYTNALTKGGFEITTSLQEEKGFMIVADDKVRKRVVALTGGGQAKAIAVTYEERKR